MTNSSALARLPCVLARLAGSAVARGQICRAIRLTGLVGSGSTVDGVGRFIAEDFETFGETALLVLAPVDKVGIVEGELDGAIENVVCGFDAEHEAMILIANLVAPAAEATARVDIHGLELGEQLGEHAFALEGGRRVAVVEASVVCGYNLIIGREHLRVDETLQGVAHDVLHVDGFHG